MLSSYAALNLDNRRYIAYGPCPEMQGQDHMQSPVGQFASVAHQFVHGPH